MSVQRVQCAKCHEMIQYTAIICSNCGSLTPVGLAYPDTQSGIVKFLWEDSGMRRNGKYVFGSYFDENGVFESAEFPASLNDTWHDGPFDIEETEEARTQLVAFVDRLKERGWVVMMERGEWWYSVELKRGMNIQGVSTEDRPLSTYDEIFNPKQYARILCPRCGKPKLEITHIHETDDFGKTGRQLLKKLRLKNFMGQQTIIHYTCDGCLLTGSFEFTGEYLESGEPDIY